MSEMSDTKRIIDLLEESLKWQRFEGAQLAKKTLRDLLAKDVDKLVYHHSNGKGSKEVATLAGVSDFTVRSYWKKWSIEGLVVPSQKFKGRYERVFALEDFGIEIPVLKGQLPQGDTTSTDKQETDNNE